MFICTQLLNELSYKVPVDQVLKQIYQALKPEQPGLSSLIRLEAVYKITWIRPLLISWLLWSRLFSLVASWSLRRVCPSVRPSVTSVCPSMMAGTLLSRRSKRLSLGISACFGFHSIIVFYRSIKPRQTNGQKDSLTNGRTNGRTDERTDERTNGQTDKRTNGRTDGESFHSTGLRLLPGPLPKKER